MVPKKKPSLSVVIGLGKPKEDHLENEMADHAADGGDGEGSELDAAQALLDAIENKDAAGVNEALKAHYELCKASHEVDEHEEGDEDGEY